MQTMSRRTRFFPFFLILLAMLAALCPELALAGGQTVGTTATRIHSQVSQMPKVIAIGTYVIGVFFAAKALLALKGFIEKPDDNPITKFLSLASVAVLLIMLPYSITLIRNTLGAGGTTPMESTSNSFSATGQ